MSHKRQVVHVTRLKKAYNPEIWKPKQEPEAPKKQAYKRFPKSEEQEEEDIRIGSLPVLEIQPPETGVEPGTPPSQDPDTPESAQQTVDTPTLSTGIPTTNPLIHYDRGVNCETRGQNRRLPGHELEPKHRTLT